MVAYEFSTEVTADRMLFIPASAAPAIPTGAQVRVILLLEEANHANGHQQATPAQPSALDQIVAQIKQMPKNTPNIQPDSGLLGKHLAELEQSIDPTFDVQAWLREWEKVEADMKHESLQREARILQEMSQ